MERVPDISILRVLWTRFTLRHWRAAPGQSMLLLLILALGIAVFFSIRLANRAAVSSFQNFTDLLSRESDWLLQAPAGALPEEVLVELRAKLGAQPVNLIPVIETTATRPRESTSTGQTIGTRTTFQIVGVDLFAMGNLPVNGPRNRDWFNQGADQNTPGGQQAGIWNSLRNGRAVFISEALARAGRFVIGSRLPLVINEQIVGLEVAGIIPADPEAPRIPETLLVMDFPALQRLAGKSGKLDRIEFVVEPGPDAAALRTRIRSEVEQLAGDRWRVSTPGDRRESAATMTRAFRVNLTILSLIALVVGLYLIVQALDGAVVRRREEIGILRSLGVEEGTILRAWMGEAALLGFGGGAFGVLLGWAGAQLAVRMVGRTVNALYYATSVNSARLEPLEVIVALVLAVAASLAAGWMPAREAARTPPAQILVRHAVAARGSPVWRNEWLGIVLLLAGWSLVMVPPLRFEGGGRFSLAGYVAAFFWILGAGILGGFILRRLAGLARKLENHFVIVRLAMSQLVRPSGRHRLAVAGLVCAIAMTSGMAILVGSFEITMSGWIKRTFQADLYLSSDGAQSASTQNRISPQTWREIASRPDVADANAILVAEIELPKGRTMLVGADMGFARRHTSLSWLQRPDDALFDADKNAGQAVVSESFTERFQVHRGDHVEVPTPGGRKLLTIAGVFSDYGNERGSIAVDRRHFVDWFHDDYVSSLILFIKPGQEPERIRAEIATRYPGLQVFANGPLRAEILRIFRQTFSITYALEVIGVFVAVIGLGLTLASVLMERRGELTTLRALGMGRHEMARTTACEGMMLAISGVMAGLLISLALGWLLIFVINKQTFGWTLAFALPWVQMLSLSVLVIAMGTGVAYGVGYWGAALPADQEE